MTGVAAKGLLLDSLITVFCYIAATDNGCPGSPGVVGDLGTMSSTRTDMVNGAFETVTNTDYAGTLRVQATGGSFVDQAGSTVVLATGQTFQTYIQNPVSGNVGNVALGPVQNIVSARVDALTAPNVAPSAATIAIKSWHA